MSMERTTNTRTYEAVHLGLSQEEIGIVPIRIEQLSDSRFDKPKDTREAPPYSLVRQVFLLYLDDRGYTRLGSYNLLWQSPELSGTPYGTLRIVNIQLHGGVRGTTDESGERHRGIGKDLYRYIATDSMPPSGMEGEEAQPVYYLTTASGPNAEGNLMDESKGMWESFVRSGEARPLPDGGYIFNTPVGSQPAEGPPVAA